ncbi:MAG: hypothetical protein KatS3mg129_0974 [Leptospiraceae bacterium]|nr:MAG: hypothetical protein KatS3mg129_0974 [Leptospiraceae bacterium]
MSFLLERVVLFFNKTKFNYSLLIKIIVFLPSITFSKPINLTELPAYLKKGFNNCNTNLNEIVSNEEWLKIPPNKNNRPIRIPKLNLKNLPKRHFIEFRSLPKVDFTLLFFIPISEEYYNSLKSPGIYFERIGESWEIFWNQQIIDRKISYTESLTTKGYIVEIPLKYFTIGNNILCIHLIGDPVSTRTGFYYGKEYYIDELKNIFYNNFYEYFLIIFLITLYISFGIFNMIFYINQKNNKYNLYFSLFCLLISIYIFSRSSLVQYIPILKNPDIASPVEFISLYLLIPVFSLFFYDIFKNKISYKLKFIFRIAEIHGFIFTIITLFPIPSNAYGGILRLWQFSAPIFIFIFALLILYFTYNEFINLYQNHSFINALSKTLIFTVPGNFLIGVIFIFIFVILDIYINIKKISAPSISNYGFLFFLSGISFRIAYNIIKLLNQLSISENKYKFLYNNSSDILILLNKDFFIKDINQSFEKILNWKKENYLGVNIERLIYSLEKTRNPILKNLIEYLNKELKKNTSIRIIIPIISNSDIPFKYFDVEFRILYIDLFGEPEILMKCSLLQKNPTIQYLIKEYQRYEMPTDFIYIERILPRITESVSEIINEMELSLIRIALREILINAIEHGNLGISNEEKTNYLLQGNYDQILKEKLNDPEIQKKKIRIEYKLTTTAIFYKITDEGEGFDVEKYLNKKNVENESLHGRGIYITKNAFDKIYYNKKGNSVLLIKYINKNTKNV